MSSCGITLKAPKSNGKTERFNPLAFSERSAQADAVKQMKTEKLRRELERQRERDEQAKPPPRRPKVHTTKPKQIEPEPVWDEDGRLITYAPEPEPAAPAKIPKKRFSEDTVRQFLDRNYTDAPPKPTQTKQKEKPLRDLPSSFHTRQEECIAKRKDLANPKPSEPMKFMSEKSKKIVSSCSGTRDLRRKRKLETESDTSQAVQTSRREPKTMRLPLMYAEARSIMREVHLQTLSVERTINEARECTFTPDMSLTSEANERVIMEMNEIRSQRSQMLSDEEDLVLEPQEKEEEKKQTRRVTPKRTKQLLKYMQMMKSDVSV